MIDKIRNDFMDYKLQYESKMSNFIQSNKVCRMEEFILRFAGINPYQREFRDEIDWMYFGLWISSIIYQWLLLLCFFFFPKSEIFSKLLELAFDPYFIAVTGYGIFNVIHRYFPQNRRINDTENDHNGIERRKKRNGHRFIWYWWFNFLIMLGATIFFNFSGDLSGPMSTSLKIAASCTAIGIGYWIAKKKWNT